MRKPVEWIERDGDGIKTRVRVTFIGGRGIRWQAQRSVEEGWTYDITPSATQWDFLIGKVEDRYRRRAASWEDVVRVRRWRDEASAPPSPPIAD